MKILLINTAEKTGGAAIACHRLLHALNKNGVEVKMLVRDRKTDDPLVETINNSRLKRYINLFRFAWERWVIFVNNRFSKQNLWKLSIANTGNDISHHPLVQEADIIHLHWVNQGMLSIRDIKKLTQLGKPIVWTMHDMWMYTGICHYAGDCNRYFEQCHRCPQLVTPAAHDLAFQTFNAKKAWYRQSVITLVGCSQWIARQAQKSGLTQKTNIVSIPNPIDIQLYKPMNKQECRQQFQLSQQKKLILFGACKATDKRKGIDYLKAACDLLFQQETFTRDDLQIVVFGGKSDEIATMLPYEVCNVGYIHSAEQMVSLYNAVDLFLIPSLEDNLPNTIMESLACGTPCVGFDIGGIPEMIDHQQNGYVAHYQDAEDLACGIKWVLNYANDTELSNNARKKVEENYTEKAVVARYVALYQSLLSL